MIDRLSSLPNGFFIPYPHAAEAVPAGYPGLRPLFAAAEAAFRAGVVAIDAYAAGLDHIARGGPGLVGERPARFEQEWFPGLDAAAAYAMVRQARPRRIIEIGSGHSTRFLAQAIVDSGLATDLVCIDPQPRAPLTGLPLRHAARLFAPADALAAAELEAGDILFVDSSHVALPGTDVDRLLLDVLPRLRDGVLIHFHDIFLPDGYPEAWARRGYNEQIAVGALMLGGGYTPVFASHYVINYTNFLAGTVVERLPQAPGGYQASLWLRKGIV